MSKPIQTFSTFYSQKKGVENPARYELDQVKEFFTDEPFRFVWTNKLNSEPKSLGEDQKITLAYRRLTPATVDGYPNPKSPDLKPLGLLPLNLLYDDDTGDHRIDLPQLKFRGDDFYGQLMWQILHGERADRAYQIEKNVKEIRANNPPMFRTVSQWEWQYYRSKFMNGFQLTDYRSHNPNDDTEAKVKREYQIYNDYEAIPSDDPLEKMFKIIWDWDIEKDKGKVVTVMDYLRIALPESIPLKDYAWMI